MVSSKELCWHWKNGRKCPKGRICKFAHGYDELHCPEASNHYNESDKHKFNNYYVDARDCSKSSTLKAYSNMKNYQVGYEKWKDFDEVSHSDDEFPPGFAFSKHYKQKLMRNSPSKRKKMNDNEFDKVEEENVNGHKDYLSNNEDHKNYHEIDIQISLEGEEDCKHCKTSKESFEKDKQENEDLKQQITTILYEEYFKKKQAKANFKNMVKKLLDYKN